jgi:hypothetical protein
MLAHAMQGNFVEFRPGRLYAEKPSKRPRKRDTGSTCVPLFEFDGSDTVRAGGEAVVIRHGPGLPFEDLEIERQEVASLRLRQIMLADFLDLERAGPKPWPDRWTRQKERGMDYLAAKWFAARALMQVIRPGCEVGFNKSGFTYEPFPAAEAKKNGALPSLERPDELFGMRVKRRAIDETDAL